MDIYGIFAYILIINLWVNVLKYSIHTWSIWEWLQFLYKSTTRIYRIQCPTEKTTFIYTCHYSKQKHSTKPTHKHLVGG